MPPCKLAKLKPSNNLQFASFLNVFPMINNEGQVLKDQDGERSNYYLIEMPANHFIIKTNKSSLIG